MNELYMDLNLEEQISIEGGRTFWENVGWNSKVLCNRMWDFMTSGSVEQNETLMNCI